MPFGQKLAVFAGLATAVAFLVAPRTAARVRPRSWFESGLPPAVVALALLIVGGVSHTFKPHVGLASILGGTFSASALQAGALWLSYQPAFR